jgi:hypothetical protein
MGDYFCQYIATMDTNDSFVFLGWCPEKVRLSNQDGKQVL